MGETAVIGSTSTLLFGGAIPPNAFMVQMNNFGNVSQGAFCVVNDNGPAGGDLSAGLAGFAVTINGSTIGGPIAPPLFVTPPGYKPIGSISVWCNGIFSIEARSW
jgi:hypothetical protein